jgi:hypothetical protein
VAHIARIVRAAAGRVSWRLSGPAASDMPAPSEGMAARGHVSIDIWDRAGLRLNLDSKKECPVVA